jgi:protein MBA1
LPVYGVFADLTRERIDLQFPYSARLRDRHLYGDWKAYKAQFKANMDNFIKNAFSLWRLAHADAIPSHTYTFPSRTMKYIKWPVQAIKAAWKYSGGWYAPFIGIANKTYRDVQTSIAKLVVMKAFVHGGLPLLD